MFEENKQKIKYRKEGRKICLKETNKKFNNSWKNAWENTEKIIKHQTMCWRKVNNALKSVGLYVIIESIRDEVKSSSNDDVDDVGVNIDADDEQERILGLR